MSIERNLGAARAKGPCGMGRSSNDFRASAQGNATITGQFVDAYGNKFTASITVTVYPGNGSGGKVWVVIGDQETATANVGQHVLVTYDEDAVNGTIDNTGCAYWVDNVSVLTGYEGAEVGYPVVGAIGAPKLSRR